MLIYEGYKSSPFKWLQSQIPLNYNCIWTVDRGMPNWEDLLRGEFSGVLEKVALIIRIRTLQIMDTLCRQRHFLPCVRHVACRMSHVACRMSHVACRMPHVACRMSHVGDDLSNHCQHVILVSLKLTPFRARLCTQTQVVSVSSIVYSLMTSYWSHAKKIIKQISKRQLTYGNL